MICLTITIYCILASQLNAYQHCKTDLRFIEDKYYNECDPEFQYNRLQEIENDDLVNIDSEFLNQQCENPVIFSTVNQYSKLSVQSSSVCPWEYEEIFRGDTYPPIRKQAKCTNNNCGIAPGYGCEPIMEPMPILRGVCQKNGLYEWTCGTENVSVGCTCAIAKDDEEPNIYRF